MTIYLDIDELAELLGQRPETIRKKLRVAPYELPPKMHFAGSKMLRWRAHEVNRWLQEANRHNRSSRQLLVTLIRRF